MIIAKSITYSINVGLCEIGAGYLVWQCLLEGRPIIYLT